MSTKADQVYYRHGWVARKNCEKDKFAKKFRNKRDWESDLRDSIPSISRRLFIFSSRSWWRCIDGMFISASVSQLINNFLIFCHLRRRQQDRGWFYQRVLEPTVLYRDLCSILTCRLWCHCIFCKPSYRLTRTNRIIFSWIISCFWLRPSDGFPFFLLLRDIADHD